MPSAGACARDQRTKDALLINVRYDYRTAVFSSNVPSAA